MATFNLVGDIVVIVGCVGVFLDRVPIQGLLPSKGAFVGQLRHRTTRRRVQKSRTSRS